MPLDPHVRRFLDMMALGQAGDPGIAARREGLRNLARLAAFEVAGVRAEELELAGPGGPLAARLYAPERNATGAGLVFLHGGGLVTGDLDTHDGICRVLAQAGGLRVVSVDYRLVPEHPFPAALDDAVAATGWVADHAARLGIDRTRLAVGGDSAGAGLAAAVCQEARLGGPAIAAQLLVCPVLDPLGESPSRRDFANGYFLDAATVRRDAATCGGADPALAARLSPLRCRDLTGLPPAHIHTAACDPVRDDGSAYADALGRAGIAVTHRCHAGMIHFFYGLGRLVPRSRPILQSIAADLAGLLAGSRAAA